MLKQECNSESIVAVGLDVHQHVVQVCVMDQNGQVLSNKRVANDLADIIDVIYRYARRANLALECSTGTAALADALIQRTGWEVHLCHPGFVRRMRQNPDKTDLSDAHLLADLVRVGYLPRVWLAPPAIRDLRTAVRYRQQLVDRLRNTKLRIRALLREYRVQDAPKRLWTKCGLAWLRDLDRLPPLTSEVMQDHLADFANNVAALARATARLREAAGRDEVITRLLTLPGIGLVTASVLRAEIGHFGRFRNAKQLARFCGLSPRNASSGERQADAGLIRGCSGLLRATLIEASHRLTRYEPRWKEYKRQLKERGKAGSVIAAAVANRWMRRLFHDLRALELAA